MLGRIVMLLIAAALIAACARPVPPERSVQLRACDDGGDGGVVIDGVCL